MTLTMSANLMQAAMMERYARRSGKPMNEAAREWIGKKAKMFRAWYEARKAGAK